MSLDDVPANSVTRSNLDNVIKAAHRAKDLVHQILAFSRQSETKRQPIRLGAIIRETLQLIRATLPTTIQISHQFNTRSDTVIGDSTQIHQVLMNLCANAGHAM